MARVHCPVFIILAMIGSAVASDPPTSSSLSSMQQAPSESAMLERMLHPNRDKKTLYEGKVFHPSGHFEAKTFQTKEYAGAKQFKSKSFASKAFESARESWIGQKLFPQKKLSEKLQGTAPDAGKKFDSKAFATKDYAGLDKQNSYGSKDAFPTKQIAPKGKTQGAIDNDQTLQEAIKKGLTIDDVKNLLNHPSAVRQ
jgi:phage pi2 protein 07